jgi:hypothetical protein
MSLDDLAGALKDLAIKVHLVELPAGEEERVRELVKELQSILDVGRTTNHKPIL